MCRLVNHQSSSYERVIKSGLEIHCISKFEETYYNSNRVQKAMLEAFPFITLCHMRILQIAKFFHVNIGFFSTLFQ